jgi:hypothetical protein
MFVDTSTSSVANRTMNGVTQRKPNQGTEAGNKNLILEFT